VMMVVRGRVVKHAKVAGCLVLLHEKFGCRVSQLLG